MQISPCLRRIEELNIFPTQLQNGIVQNASYPSVHSQDLCGQEKFALKCTYVSLLREAFAQKNFQSHFGNAMLDFQVFHQKYQPMNTTVKLVQEWKFLILQRTQI